MGSKKVLPTFNLFKAATMSGTATILSPITSIMNTDNESIQVKWTGTPTGTISVLVSNDGIQFDPITFSPGLAQPAGAAGQYTIMLAMIPCAFIQLQYVNASGSGLLTATIFGKDVN